MYAHCINDIVFINDDELPVSLEDMDVAISNTRYQYHGPINREDFYKQFLYIHTGMNGAKEDKIGNWLYCCLLILPGESYRTLQQLSLQNGGSLPEIT